MSLNKQFEDKWDQSLKKDASEEFSAFVPKGSVPRTQRQLFLYQYYTFIKSRFGEIPPKDSLEVGCGRGTVSLYFNLYEGMDVALSDVAESAISLAKENLAFHNAEGKAVVASADNTPFQNEVFDLVFSIGLLEHLDDYQGVVNEKYRVLRKGAMVASLNIPKKSSVQVLNTIYRFILRLFGKGRELKADYYRNDHTPEMFKEAFEKAGFTDIEVVYITPFPIFTPLYPWLEHTVTALYRFLLFVRGIFMRHPFVTNKYVGQAHMIVARKPE